MASFASCTSPSRCAVALHSMLLLLLLLLRPTTTTSAHDILHHRLTSFALRVSQCGTPLFSPPTHSVLGEFVYAATKALAGSTHAGTRPTPGGNFSTSHALTSNGGDGDPTGEVEEACFGEQPNYFGAFVAILSVIALKMLYFDLSDAIRPSDAQTQHVNGPRHALQRGFVPGLYWQFAHAPLFIAMLCIASVLEEYVAGECMTNPNIVLMSSATAVVILTLSIMGLLHSGGEPRMRAHRGLIRKQTRTIARFLFALAALSPAILIAWVTSDAAANSWKSHTVALANTLLLSVVVSFDFIGRSSVAVSDEARAAYAAEQVANSSERKQGRCDSAANSLPCLRSQTKRAASFALTPSGGFEEALDAPLIQRAVE